MRDRISRQYLVAYVWHLQTDGFDIGIKRQSVTYVIRIRGRGRKSETLLSSLSLSSPVI